MSDLAVSDDIEIESNGAPASVEAPAPVVASVEATEGADDALEAASDDLEVVGEPAPKKDRSLQARINEQTAKQRAAERERDAATAKAAELERRLQALEQPRQAERQPAAQEPRYTRAKPSEAEIGGKYPDYPAYIEDLTDWKLEQRDAQQAERSQRRAVAERHAAHAESFTAKIDAAEKLNPDFWKQIDPAVANLAPSAEFDPTHIAAAQKAASQGDASARQFLAQLAIADMIFDSEHSTGLMAMLRASDLQRLSTLPPAQLYREMGRLEASVMRPVAASAGPVPKTPAISHAPAPIKPVGTSASASEANPLEQDLDMDEHIRVMNARDKKTGRFK